jgi:splicing factor 1
METESQAKIAIRGKGSVKEGKGRSDAAHTSNQEEDLHCLIMADTEEKVNKAKKLIHNIIETVRLSLFFRSRASYGQDVKSRHDAKQLLTSGQAASIPEGQNELKRNQLRELAALNGTLRDDENQACQNCGQIGHRKYDCPEQRNFTANIICRTCGNAGHMARDCTDRTKGSDWRNGPPQAGGPAGQPGAGPTAGRIGGGDVVDREMEVSSICYYSITSLRHNSYVFLNIDKSYFMKTFMLTPFPATHARTLWWRPNWSTSATP